MKKLFRIASDLGVCDSNRIAHRDCIARFGPLSFGVCVCVCVCARARCLLPGGIAASWSQELAGSYRLVCYKLIRLPLLVLMYRGRSPGKKQYW